MSEPSKQLATTYVFHGDRTFNVSTIDRDSSSMAGGRYAETMVWECDSRTKDRLGMVGQFECGRGSLREHFAVCARLLETGSADEPSED